MSVREDDATEISRAAYAIAWAAFQRFPQLTPDEKQRGPEKLRGYITALALAGERNPDKIAMSALGLIRQYEQILQSQGRLDAKSRASGGTDIASVKH